MIHEAWAQGGAAGAAPPALVQFLPLLLIFVVFYFVLIRPQQQKAKEHESMLANLKRNDSIVTSGGIHGRIMELAEGTVVVEIAPNVRVRVDRPQIASLLDKSVSHAKEKDKEK